MHQERENLDIIFRRTTPEVVLDNIRESSRFHSNNKLVARVEEYPFSTYERYASLSLMNYSSDELELRHQALQKVIMDSENTNGKYFELLVAYADKVLTLHNNTPICKIDEILNFNSISLRLGQDLFVTSWLAWKDFENTYNSKKKHRFSWSAILKTDDKQLELLYKNGLAENHFHLHGSTQNFAISWVCLMNHPEYLSKYFREKKYFSEDLELSITKGIADNHMSWEMRVLYASKIRAILFQRCIKLLNGEETVNNFKIFDRLPLSINVKEDVESLKSGFGMKFEQIDNKKLCLDYAISRILYDVDVDSCNRLLSGERSLLYHCFLLQFEGKFSLQESNLFYLYILLKSNFRSELVQVNNRVGFRNFLNYQDRKNQFYDELEEYNAEALRLSVGASITDNHTVSLEARIMPKDTSRKMRNSITYLNKLARMCPDFRENILHYVIHFPKEKFCKDEFEKKKLDLLPRNVLIRKMTKTKARALHKYLLSYGYSDAEITGIDACAKEIGCRPETFATEFRFLRDCPNQIRTSKWWCQESANSFSKLYITYHVGEDFLDIIDGLRAIDEAVSFLNMQKGDRIGHGIALGIDAEDYYEQKQMEVYFTKQDLLDNLVWLLYRSLELEVEIASSCRVKLSTIARKLFCYIYYGYDGDFTDVLDTYYESWKLRGDHPELYKSGNYKEIKSLSFDNYEDSMCDSKKLCDIRKNKMICRLYYSYHFDHNAKMRGLEPEKYIVEDWYIKTVSEMQRAMQLKIAKKGIAIECNPSSNVLISTFRRYDKHPILNFNNYHLTEDNDENPHIQVSINTDDIGVFDTSLENEYALLFSAIKRIRQDKGRYNDEEIYEYLEHIRKNGIRMSFKEDIPLYSNVPNSPDTADNSDKKQNTDKWWK